MLRYYVKKKESLEKMSKSLGLYIHIPFCIKKCNYCDFTSYSDMENYWIPYIDAIIGELEFNAEKFKESQIKSIFIGGGTPSLLPGESICKILHAVYKKFRVVMNCETSIECNPGTLTQDKLLSYKEAGINRISIGLQAYQENTLKKLGRMHTYKDFIFAFKTAQKLGFKNINADIIFGIPDQTFEQWHETLTNILNLNLQHISCYSLKIEEGTVFGKLHQEGRLNEISDELDRKMYHYAIELFDKAGFSQYEISNFSKPQYICQHNMNYWERGEYIGIGAGAHSFIGCRRYANTADVKEYIEGIRNNQPALSEDSILTADEGISERIILGLRLKKGIDLRIISEEFGLDLENKYKNSIQALQLKNLIECDGTCIRLTNKGLDMANMAFVEFI